MLQTNHLYNTHLPEDDTTFYKRTNLFKYSFFPTTILEWNKFDRRIWQSTVMLSLSNTLLNIERPTPKQIYNIHDPNGLTLLTRFRLEFSHLNEHKLNHFFKERFNLLCSCCFHVGSFSHFFLCCHYFKY